MWYYPPRGVVTYNTSHIQSDPFRSFNNILTLHRHCLHAKCHWKHWLWSWCSGTITQTLSSEFITCSNPASQCSVMFQSIPNLRSNFKSNQNRLVQFRLEHFWLHYCTTLPFWIDLLFCWWQAHWREFQTHDQARSPSHLACLYVDRRSWMYMVML